MTATVLAGNWLDVFGTGCLASHPTRWGCPINGHISCTGWDGKYPATDNAEPSKVIQDVVPKFSDANDPIKHCNYYQKSKQKLFRENIFNISPRENIDKRRTGVKPSCKSKECQVGRCSTCPTHHNNSAGFTRSLTWSQRAHQRDPAWSFRGWINASERNNDQNLGKYQSKKSEGCFKVNLHISILGLWL